MNARTLLFALASVALALTACDKSPPNHREDPPPADDLQVDVTPGPDTLPIDHPPIDQPPVDDGKVSADVQRVSLHQLERSISAVLGNDANGNPITWMLGNANGFSRYGPTLGVADFINTTEENLEPSALYLKFAGDMARDVCNRALAADAQRTVATERVITRFAAPTDTVQSAPAAVDENLRYLKLRFHGVHVDGDGAKLAPLKTLFATAVEKAAGTGTPTAAHVRTGWHAVCVALITDPEFHLY